MRNVITLSVAMLSVTMISVVMLKVIMLNVVAPLTVLIVPLWLLRPSLSISVRQLIFGYFIKILATFKARKKMETDSQFITYYGRELAVSTTLLEFHFPFWLG
jgi:hypothetical protein